MLHVVCLRRRPISAAELLLRLSLCAHLAAAFALGAWFFRRGLALWRLGAGFLVLGVAFQAAFAVARWAAGGRPPLANTFESLVFLALSAGALTAWLALVRGWRSIAPPGALVVLAITVLAALMENRGIEPLPPALRHRLWLAVHVALCMLSYAAFLLAYLAALALLAGTPGHAAAARAAAVLTAAGVLAAVGLVAASRTEAWALVRPRLPEAALGLTVVGLAGGLPLAGWLERRAGLGGLLPEAARLEAMARRSVELGLPLLTAGIATGSYWASIAWGRYWGWDDKETASLVTWLVFVAYLHAARAGDGPRRAASAWLVVAGFWCAVLTYFGVSYLRSGLHSYG